MSIIAHRLAAADNAEEKEDLARQLTQLYRVGSHSINLFSTRKFPLGSFDNRFPN